MKHSVKRNYEEDSLTIVDTFYQFLEDKKAHNLSKSSLTDYS